MPLRWRLYYSDSTFSSDDGTWSQAPSGDVQVLLWWTHEGPTLLHGVDSYWLPGRKTTKEGRTIPDEEYDRILRQAFRDARHV